MGICSISFIHIKNIKRTVMVYLKFSGRRLSTKNLEIFAEIVISIFKGKCICQYQIKLVFQLLVNWFNAFLSHIHPSMLSFDQSTHAFHMTAPGEEVSSHGVFEHIAPLL